MQNPVIDNPEAMYSCLISDDSPLTVVATFAAPAVNMPRHNAVSTVSSGYSHSTSSYSSDDESCEPLFLGQEFTPDLNMNFGILHLLSILGCSVCTWNPRGVLGANEDFDSTCNELMASCGDFSDDPVEAYEQAKA